MEFFENTVKTNFDGNNKFFVPVHGVARRPGVNKGRLELTAADLRGIFEPVIKEVIRLIAAQIQDTNKAVVKLILLVGGFGGSSFLRRWVRDKFPDIDVRVAQNLYVFRNFVATRESHSFELTEKLKPNSSRERRVDERPRRTERWQVVESPTC